MNCRQISFEGHSMYPALRPGDTLVVRAVQPHQCVPGDIVCLPHGRSLTVHRLVGLELGANPPVLVTKGDNLTYCDPPTAALDSVLKVVMISRGGGRLTRPRFGRLLAALSCRNATVGIIRGRLGRAARRLFRPLLPQSRRGASDS